MQEPIITSRTDWTPELLQEVWTHIEDVAKNDLKLDYYEPQIEIISAEQMLDCYASTGIPVMYNHWSFGKQFVKDQAKYKAGKMGLALEIVINTSPAVSYLMEENNAIAQALVMAHAAVGHSFVFKNNYLFKDCAMAGSIIDYMMFAKKYIKECEEKYGEDNVELLLDAAHTISAHSIDKYKRKHLGKNTLEQQRLARLKDDEEQQKKLDNIIKKTSAKHDEEQHNVQDLDLVGDEENLMYFIYKNSPILQDWEREILRIIYKIQLYFAPQRVTQTVNEGMATFTHFYIMDELEKRGVISEDAQLAWLHLHSSVIYQPDMHSPHYDGKFNPYALGFDILKEIRRVCENPTQEDKEWFPNLVGKDWREEIKHAVSEYNDESFIEQFMTPALMRKYKMMTIEHYQGVGNVTEIADDIGYRNMRKALALQYNPVHNIPDIVIKSARMKGDRMLTLEYRPYRMRSLYAGYAEKTMQHIKLLWGYDCELVTTDDNNVQKVICKV